MASIQVSGLVAKMKNVDADLRFMALNDLMSECAKTNGTLDTTTEAQVVEQVLAMFNDTNSEVKNQAVKAIGALVKKVSEARQMFIIDTLITYSAATKDDQLRDLANLGLRTVIREIQPGTELSSAATIGKLVPQLLDQLNQKASPTPTPDMLLNAAELLHDLFARFESDARPHEELQVQTLQTLVQHIGNKRPAVQKRVVDALAQLVAVAPPTTDALLQTLISDVIHPTLSGSSTAKVDTITVVSLIGAIGVRAPEKLGRAVANDSELITKLLAAGQTRATVNGDTAMDEDSGEEDSDTAQLADLREAVLSSLERLLLKCPKEMSPFVSATLALAASLISWDPNFAGGDDDEDGDDAMEGDDADDVEDDFEEEYSDDEDASWKVRRASARVFRAAFETRPEMLSYFVNTSAPLLLGRFSEREQSVKLEVWSTYARLLDIVKLLGLPATNKVTPPPGSPLPSRGTREDTPTSLKRKRGAQDNAMSLPSPPEEASLVSTLDSQSAAVCKTVLKQISPKSIAISQSGFVVLDALVSVLNGGLEDHLAAFAPAIEMALPSKVSTGAAESSAGTVTSLKITVLSFVAKIFVAHPPAAFGPSLGSKLVPCLVACTADKFNKIASGGFKAVSALVKSIRANTGFSTLPDRAAILKSLYQATAARLEAPATDSEVRESAVVTLGDILFNVGDQLGLPLEQPLALLSDSLRREVTRIVGVRTAGKVAASPLLQGKPVLSAWISESIPEIASFLRQNNRVLKVDSFACLPVLIGAAGPALSPQVVESTLNSVSAFVSAEDLLLFPSAVTVISTLLQAQPQATLKAQSFQSALSSIYNLVDSPLLQSGLALDSLLGFFGTLVKAGIPPTQIIDKLKRTTSRAGPRCIGAVVQQSPDVASSVADGFITAASASKSSDASVVFALHALGEIGRVPGYQGAGKAFSIALTKMTEGSSEEVRASAAFALGNLAVGSEDLVDQVTSHISSGSSQEAVLALHALKEFITHAQPSAISTRADSLWQPLFSICAIDGPPPPEAGLPADAKPDEKKKRDQRIEAEFKKNEPVRSKWQQTDQSRSVAAECLGKITLTDPNRFLPLLQSRTPDKLAGIRCAIITAIRFTLVDNSQEYDSLLQPTIVSFLSLMKDANLDVRRIALSTFNTAASHKTHLIRDSLPALLPILYNQTIINNDFVRIVEMGPFKHRVDDGLEPRKAAYEACYTLLDTCLGRFDALEMLDVVLRGLSDDNEIRAICYLMLIRLAQVAPAATTLRLDAATPAFTAILNEKLKDSAVKQEQERHQQVQKSALRAFVSVSKLASPTSTPKFVAALEEIKKTASPWHADYKGLVTETGRSGGADMEMD